MPYLRTSKTKASERRRPNWERARSAERREAKSSSTWVPKMSKIWSRRALLRRLNQSLKEETRRSLSLSLGRGRVVIQGSLLMMMLLLLSLLSVVVDEEKDEY